VLVFLSAGLSATTASDEGATVASPPKKRRLSKAGGATSTRGGKGGAAAAAATPIPAAPQAPAHALQDAPEHADPLVRGEWPPAAAAAVEGQPAVGVLASPLVNSLTALLLLLLMHHPRGLTDSGLQPLPPCLRGCRAASQKSCAAGGSGGIQAALAQRIAGDKHVPCVWLSRKLVWAEACRRVTCQYSAPGALHSRVMCI
jgi:hypothetical protein